MTRELVLSDGKLLRLDGARGRVIRCTSGCAWITAPGVAADIFLHGGESWAITCDGRVLVEAVGAATVSVQRS